MMLDKAEKARKARDDEHKAAKKVAEKLAALQKADEAQQRQKAEAERERLNKERTEGQKVKDLNTQLENLLAKVQKIE